MPLLLKLLVCKMWHHFEVQTFETQIKSSQWFLPTGTEPAVHLCRPLFDISAFARFIPEPSGKKRVDPGHSAANHSIMSEYVCKWQVMTMPFCRKNRSNRWRMFTDSRRCAANANSIWMYTSAWDSIKYRKIDFVFALRPSYSIPIDVIYCTSHSRWLKAFNIRPKFNCVPNSFRQTKRWKVKLVWIQLISFVLFINH